MSKAAELANLIGNINAGGGGVNRNVIINGAMNVAQRGTSSTGVGASDGYFVCDRWHLDSGASTDGRLTMTQDSSAPSGFANSLKLDCTTADTSIASGEILKIEQRIEGQNLQAFAKGTSDAKPFAVSFYVKGNASATYVCELFDQDNSRFCSKTFNVTTDWTRVELTFPADTTGAFDNDNAHSLSLNFWLNGGGSFTSGTLNSSGFAANNGPDRAAGISSFFDSTDRTFFLTGVQLEVGQNPTEFEHEPFQVTYEKCLRYFEKSFLYGDTPAGGISGTVDRAVGIGFASNAKGHQKEFNMRKRTSPTLVVYRGNNAGSTNSGTISWYNGSSWSEITPSGYNVKETVFRVDTQTSGVTNGNAYLLDFNYTADAEL